MILFMSRRGKSGKTLTAVWASIVSPTLREDFTSPPTFKSRVQSASSTLQQELLGHCLIIVLAIFLPDARRIRDSAMRGRPAKTVFRNPECVCVAFLKQESCGEYSRPASWRRAVTLTPTLTACSENREQKDTILTTDEAQLKTTKNQRGCKDNMATAEMFTVCPCVSTYCTETCPHAYFLLLHHMLHLT